MFTTAQCGLTLLFESALEEENVEEKRLRASGLWCDEESLSVSEKPRTEARVAFCERVCVQEIAKDDKDDLDEEKTALSETLARIPRDEAADAESALLDRRLDEAVLNGLRNRKVFRYGEPSPVTQANKRRRDAPCEGTQWQSGHILREAWLSNEAAV